MERILLLSLRAGAGHIRAADAVAQAAAERFPRADIRHIEVLEYTTTVFRRSFTSVYGSLITRFPSLWRMLYENTERQVTDTRLRKFSSFVNRVNSRSLQREIAAFDPDVVVCTHFLPAQVLANRKTRSRFRARLCVVMTDYDVHTMWVHRGVDLYCVATDEMAYALHALGVSHDQIRVTGIPILRQFQTPFAARPLLRRKLGLDPERPVVLISGGGCGLGALERVVGTLARQHPRVQLLTVAGGNQPLYETLRTLATRFPGTIVPFGYVDNMHELMAASDLAVTKPGGLTVTECLVLGLPMILVNPIPGQEERNSDVLLEHGAALCAHSPFHLEYKVGALLDNPARLELMSRAARALSRPAAAAQIAAAALDVAVHEPALAV